MYSIFIMSRNIKFGKKIAYNYAICKNFVLENLDLIQQWLIIRRGRDLRLGSTHNFNINVEV
jgi:hypothetical protein